MVKRLYTKDRRINDIYRQAHDGSKDIEDKAKTTAEGIHLKVERISNVR